MKENEQIKRIDTILGILNTFSVMNEANVAGRKDELLFRQDIFRDEVDDIIIDTACTPDTGRWETGILRSNGNVTIVEQYENREKARQGHDKWVQLMKNNPEWELEDIDLWGLKK